MICSSKRSLRDHQSLLHPHARFWCKLCGSTFITTDAFYEHFDTAALDLQYHEFVYAVLHDVNPPDALANEMLAKAAADAPANEMPDVEEPESIDCQFCYEAFESKDAFYQHWHIPEVDIECHGHLYDLLEAYEEAESDEDEDEAEDENDADEDEDNDKARDEDEAEDENDADEAEDNDKAEDKNDEDEAEDNDKAEDKNDEDEDEAEDKNDEDEDEAEDDTDEDHKAKDED